jgi:long-chain fatty acid transport protein
MNKLTAACLMVLSSVAFGAGFQLDVAGARATGMGGAVTALVDDPSSIYFNPSGIAGHKGLDVSVGVTAIIPMISFTHAADGNVTSTPFALVPPPNAHVAFGITEDLSLGVGLFVPFGASNTWPTDWEGDTKAHSSSLQTFDIQPTIAYRVHPRLKIGLGFNAVRGTVLIERALNFVDTKGSVKLGGAAWGYGWNAGAMITVVEKYLTVGATYRSSVGMHFTGNSHFSNVPVEFSGLLKDQTITADVNLPAQANFGFGFTPMEKLRFGLDFHYTEWTSFPELAIRFENPALTNPLAKSWTDQVSVHFGAEYDITKSVSARLGFVWDPTPSPAATLTPDLPDSTRVKICAGVSWHHDSGFRVDFGYQFVALLGADSYAPGFEGRYSGTAQVIGLNVGFRMPNRETAAATEPAAEPPPANLNEAPPAETAPAPKSETAPQG